MERLLLGALALLLAAAPAVPAAALDLGGTWHVLVHYKDSATENPERERWEDRVWVFEKEGSRLRWADYPIVVFADDTGRFERLGGNRASRVLHFWEPNAAQLAQIQAGLEVNSRGSRSKALEGSDAAGWSSGRKGGYESARFITFEEVWQITGLPDRPSFIRDDVMGSASTEAMEGRTTWEGEVVEPGGDVIRGRYDRDGTRIGTFRMMRAGTVSTVKGSGRTQSERARDALASAYVSQLFADDLPGGVSEAELRGRIEAGEFSDGDRRDLLLGFERSLAESFQEQGNDPRQLRPEIQSLARQMVDLFVDQGKTIAEIKQMLVDGSLRP
jgi:hypothetical protein